jgi:hypothetical protein
MSDRNFSRRRRGGMRFRPSGGLGHGQQRPDREASQARAEAVGGPPTDEKVYDNRHRQEIERAENQAAGLPAEGVPAETTEATPPGKKDFREPNFDTPEQVQEQKPFSPVPIQERPKGIVESLRSAANNLVKKVQRLIKPVKKIHKEEYEYQLEEPELKSGSKIKLQECAARMRP